VGPLAGGPGRLAGRPVEQAEPTLAQLLAESRAAAGHHPLVSSYFLLGRVQRARGRLGAALGTYQEGLELAAESGRLSTFHAAEAQVGIGQVLYERNQLDDARRHLTEGLGLCRPLANPSCRPSA
jgi:LuxR family transcriptional regulator, maltose regulon positive regulatory protein